MATEFTRGQIDKVGHSIIFLGEKVSELTKTKLLKLLFLLEEKSIKDFATPFFGIDFKIWRFGPVAPPIFDALSNVQDGFLSSYIAKNRFDEYEGVIPFNDDEFSDNDIWVLEWAVNFARHKIAEDFVHYTHSPESLWKRGAIEYNLYDKFMKRELMHTDHSIDFTLLFENDDEGFRHEKYSSALENLEFAKKYKEVRSV